MATSKDATKRLNDRETIDGLAKESQMANNELPDNEQPGTLNFWCKMRYWEPREAAALIMGIVPTTLTEEEATSASFTSLETLIARITLKPHPRPTLVMAKLRKLGIDVPDDLFDTCWVYNKKYNSKSMRNSELRAELKAAKSQVNTTLHFSNGKDKRSLLAIACAAISLIPGAKSITDNKVAAKLDDQLSQIGFPMGERTLNNWLDAINTFAQDNCEGT